MRNVLIVPASIGNAPAVDHAGARCILNRTAYYVCPCACNRQTCPVNDAGEVEVCRCEVVFTRIVYVAFCKAGNGV